MMMKKGQQDSNKTTSSPLARLRLRKGLFQRRRKKVPKNGQSIVVSGGSKRSVNTSTINKNDYDDSDVELLHSSVSASEGDSSFMFTGSPIKQEKLKKQGKSLFEGTSSGKPYYTTSPPPGPPRSSIADKYNTRGRQSIRFSVTSPPATSPPPPRMSYTNGGEDYTASGPPPHPPSRSSYIMNHRLSTHRSSITNPTIRRGRRSSIRDSIISMRRSSSIMVYETTMEMKRLHTRVSVRTLLNDEIQRYRKKGNLMFPEAPTIWDIFWIGLLALFVLSVIPGLYYFVSRSYPFHWQPTGENVTFDNINVTMPLYETAGYGIVTPLSKPMPSYFIIHVTCGCLASVLLLILFTTGRVIRWRLADGTVDYDSAEDLHKLAAFWSFFLWIGIIVTGTITIPILHPVLQIANYAEMMGVTTMFVGALLSAYMRQWVFHRLLVWGLLYSCVASVFVGVSGRSLQAWSGMTAFEIKAIGYTVAFVTPIVGLIRDLIHELMKLRKNDSAEEALRAVADKQEKSLRKSSLCFTRTNTPFNSSRGDKLRRLSFWQHVMQAEPVEEHNARRHSSIYRTESMACQGEMPGTRSTNNAIMTLRTHEDLKHMFEDDYESTVFFENSVKE